MKTVLLIDTSGARYFRRSRGQWQKIDKPDDKDSLWVIADLPEEVLERLELPLLFGRDRAHFLQRHLATAFPNSQFRAIIAGNLFRLGHALLTGLNAAGTISRELENLKNPVAGVWGIFMLQASIMRRLGIDNIMLVSPGQHYLRMLVIRHAVPVVTRCIHRYSEKDSDADEIQRTRLHLENHQVFEQEAIPPVLYLGDPASSGIAELMLMPLPDAMKPKGDASYLHALFEEVASSPKGQIAPLPFRFRYLGNRIRQAAYLLTALCLLTGMLFAQHDRRSLFSLDTDENRLQKNLQQETAQRQHLANRIKESGTNPALMQQAIKFSTFEIDAAPTPNSVLQFVAASIAGLQDVRIKSLSYRLLEHGERRCQKEPTRGDKRYAELQFSILLIEHLPISQQSEIRKRISDNIRRNAFVQVMEDPAAASNLHAIQSGSGAASAEDVWCMILPWPALRQVLP